MEPRGTVFSAIDIQGRGAGQGQIIGDWQFWPQRPQLITNYQEVKPSTAP